MTTNWPGRPITEEDVEIAATRPQGKGRDIFTLDQRIKAFRGLKLLHEQARKRPARPRWRTELVLGPMGEGKTNYLIWCAALAYAHGITFFHNGGPLFGQVLADEEVWTVIDRVPPFSVVAFDEFHTLHQSGAGAARPELLQIQMLSGLRKQNCDVKTASALEDEVSPRVKRHMEHVVYPMKLRALPGFRQPWTVEASLRRSMGLQNRYAPSDANSLFQMGVYRITNWPYRAPSLADQFGIQRGDQRKAVRFYRIPPVQVRLAMLLNDSFAPVRAGVAMTADRQAVVDAQRDRLMGGFGEVIPEPQRIMFALFEALDAGDIPKTGYMRVKELHQAIRGSKYFSAGITPRRMSRHLQDAAGVLSTNNGYKMLDLYAMVSQTVESFMEG